jgi:hypothetical protein
METEVRAQAKLGCEAEEADQETLSRQLSVSIAVLSG